MWIIGILCAIVATGISIVTFVQNRAARRRGYYSRDDIPCRTAAFVIPAGLVLAVLSLSGLFQQRSDNVEFTLAIAATVVILLAVYGLFVQEYGRYKQSYERHRPSYPYTAGV